MCPVSWPARAGPVVLVVGDSLVAAAAVDLTGLTPRQARTMVLAGVGASPCDLWAGYRTAPALGNRTLSFRTTVRALRPQVVVLAFTGNPGVSDHACVNNPNSAYSLSLVVSAYHHALEDMGTAATATGARVFLSATPARNPSVPEGWQLGSQHGYNGDPAFNVMMSALASSHGWTYDTGAAAAISGPGLGWTLYLPCQSASRVTCVDGRKQVRYGGTDAIHCDAPGTNGVDAPSDGSLRFARGMLTSPLAAEGLRPADELRAPTTTAAAKGCSTSVPSP